ncbi:uncharacterized protein KGF55_002047 [Candida pseudojiufengensis]|uniref:uncharacterized protein n=1 Tax=Candida pseudojiufengensis TaxID=497109 RepID=UPI0022251FD6|nr:uncharacterized protein KGF55_002047 [Candida pseudojiufengensis]KAI5964105.1 hypothetical protein KGF55_002047 [Candida pseudojiufengensis]
MEIIKQKHSPLKRLLHKWQSKRNIPFRRKFFVGYDLHGNTYWEFTIDGNLSRLRRKLEPYAPQVFKVDYFKTIPPQWLQWLRRTRNEPPSLNELVGDQIRQRNLKILGKRADEKWKNEKLRLEQEEQLQDDLKRIELGKSSQREPLQKEDDDIPKTVEEENPWKQADETRDSNPIQAATIKPRN